MQWSELTVLVTGGTGSFGKKFTQIMLEKYRPKKLIVFSRDELKQHDMEKEFAGHERTLRFFIGDVRDRERLHRAMQGVDVVVHAAAMKQVPACEYNPFEAVMTNLNGARNVIEAALDAQVKRAVLVSTDKAVNPVNLYGGTKLCAEKLFVHGNSYSGKTGTRLGVVRYGNVIGSRGSVLPVFAEQRKSGYVTVTDERMTRFWLTLESGVEFVIQSIEDLSGGEIFVPKIPTMRIIDLARLLAAGAEIRVTGIRSGEKLHECLISEDEARHTVSLPGRFVVRPNQPWWEQAKWDCGDPLPDGFRYTSDTNTQWLDTEEFIRILRQHPELSRYLPAEAEAAAAR